MNNDPFFGFTTLRSVMARGSRGPTWTLVVLGVVVALLGLFLDHLLLTAIGILVILVGAWPLVAGRADRRRAEQLAEHARREDEILAAARDIVNEAVGTNAGRGGLAALITADPSAADVARNDCLRRAARASGDERDAWLDAANEIGHLRAPEEISS